MDENKYCQLINNLIPRYVKGQCTDVERAFLEKHCADCPECRVKLMRAKDRVYTAPVREILFLSRPKKLKTSHRQEGKLKKQERAESISRKVASRRAEDTDSEAVVIPKQKQIRWFIPLLIAAAVIIVIVFRSIPVLNQPEEPYSASIESAQAEKTEQVDLMSEEVTASPEEDYSEEEAAETAEDFVIDWNDSVLEARMRKITGVSSGDIMYSDVKSITELDLSDCAEPIDIGALSYLTNLKELNLFKSKISNIGALSSLTNLNRLDLKDTGITDIGALSRLTNLNYLDLSRNHISDINVLSNLTNLEVLYLGNNGLSDINVLSNLTNLEVLYLGNNGLSDISALSSLRKLDSLFLHGNHITDISPLSNLTNLESLSLVDNQISDISALNNLTDLKKLYLSDNQISDISALKSLKKLTFLNLRDNLITDYSPIEQLNIEDLYY